MKTRSNYWQLLPYIRPQWQNIIRGFVGILGYVLATLTLINVAGKLAVPFGQGNVVAIAQLVGICASIFLVRGFFQSVQDIYMAKAALRAAFHLRQQVYGSFTKTESQLF